MSSRPIRIFLLLASIVALAAVTLPLYRRFAGLTPSVPDLSKTLTTPDYEALRTQGRNLTADEAQAIEHHLKRDPDDFAQCCRLLAYAYRHRQDSATALTAYHAHVLWVVENRPATPVAVWPECLPLPFTESLGASRSRHTRTPAGGRDDRVRNSVRHG